MIMMTVMIMMMVMMKKSYIHTAYDTIICKKNIYIYLSERRGKQLRAIRMAKLFHFVTRSLHIAFVIRMN